MSRYPRIYGKKRRHRHTIHPNWGSAGESLFFAVFLVVGAAGLAALVANVLVPEWIVNQDFLQSEGLIVKKRLAQVGSDDRPQYRPELLVRYEVKGKKYETWTYNIRRSTSGDHDRQQALLDQFEVGQRYALWYNPRSPEVAVLVQGYSWLNYLLVIPLGFLLIGSGGLISALRRWGVSAERSAARAGPVQSLDIMKGADSQPGCSAIPDDSNWTNSPGTHLAYRLPITVSHGWRLWTAALTCLVWNGVVVSFLVTALADRPINWLLLVFILPFALLGGYLTYRVIREVVVTTGIGPTHVEISAHPLLPEERYDVFIRQEARLTMNRLEVFLVCEEGATYRQGSDTRTEIRRVYEKSLLRRDSFEILPGLPFEVQFQLEIPQNPVTSFQGMFNQVQWKLLVEANAAGWPKFDRSFPVLVCPRRLSQAPTGLTVTPAHGSTISSAPESAT